MYFVTIAPDRPGAKAKIFSPAHLSAPTQPNTDLTSIKPTGATNGVGKRKQSRWKGRAGAPMPAVGIPASSSNKLMAMFLLHWVGACESRLQIHRRLQNCMLSSQNVVKFVRCCSPTCLGGQSPEYNRMPLRNPSYMVESLVCE